MKTTWIPRVGVIMTVLLLSATLAQAQSNELLVSHVQAALDPQTAKVDVWYRLETVDGGPVTVSLFLSTDSGATYPYLCETVSGDAGAGVPPGTSRHLVWDARVDRPGFSSTTCRLRVTANDGANPDDFVYVSPGTFIMGSPTTEVGHDDYDDETQHQVTLTHGFYMQTTEVTNQQYRDMAQWAYGQGFAIVVGDSILCENLDGSTQGLLYVNGDCEISFSGGAFAVDAGKASHPVMGVTWYGSVAYCDWLSLQQGLPRAYNHSTWQCNAGDPYTAPGYRLPTEAEWEYACRAGTQTPFNTGSCLDAGTEANYCGSGPYTGCPSGPYVGWTVPVGSYPANAFGLYDMHGNLFEWCTDWYDSYGGTVTDPVGAGSGSGRVIRGGGWRADPGNCRAAFRYGIDPSDANIYLGFRVVRSSAP
jgi:formylglycine-generating enzyme required for sulfatase activity